MKQINGDRKTLRDLASAYFRIANSDKNKMNIIAHKKVNDLKGVRPIVLIDEIPWKEMNLDNELTLQCTDPLLRWAESRLRMVLYKWKHMPADMVVPPYFEIPKIILSSGNGMDKKISDSGSTGTQEIHAHTFEDQVQSMEDLEKFHNEVITYDEVTTMERYYRIADVFGDILPIKVCGDGGGWNCACKIWDQISTYKSLDMLFFSLLDEPELMHALASKLTDILIDKHRQYNKLGLFEGDSYALHCTAGLTDDLYPDYTHVTSKDVWGRGIAQIFSEVSPQMHEEFDITYQVKALKDFGLVYYGCCEPLHNKIHILEKIPNLRKISITPWADVDIAAEIMGKKYVLASKPNPAIVSCANFDEEAARAELVRIVSACKRNGCSCDIVLKDISTVSNRPENLFKWEKIAMEVVNSY